MMISEDRIDPSNIGIKNTYFIAEAYAMFGSWFIFPSVIIYSINFALGYIILVKLLNRVVTRRLELNKKIVSVFLFTYISVTGGCSELLIMKSIIMIVLLMMPILLMPKIFRFNF